MRSSLLLAGLCWLLPAGSLPAQLPPAGAPMTAMPPAPGDDAGTAAAVLTGPPCCGGGGLPRSWVCPERLFEPCLSLTGEYLLWWVKDAPVPIPLLTASRDPVNNPRALLTEPSTVVLFGGRDYDFGAFSGVRATAHWRLNDCVGLEAEGFLLEQQVRNFRVRSDAIGNPALATPFFDVLNNQEFSSFYSLPTPGGGAAGFALRLTSQLWGAESNLTAEVWRDDSLRLRLLAGFRYLEVEEGLFLDDVALFFAPTDIFRIASFPAFSTFPAFNEFGTNNQFYGGQLGAQAEYRCGRWQVEGQVKVALGGVREVLRINGGTGAIPPGSQASVLKVPGDSFALSSNIGRHSQSEFAVLPEVRLNIGIWLTAYLHAFIGYNFLYLSEVLRPGETIDRRWNRTLIPTFGLAPTGPALPVPLFRSSDIHAHGLNLGLGLHF